MTQRHAPAYGRNIPTNLSPLGLPGRIVELLRISPDDEKNIKQLSDFITRQLYRLNITTLDAVTLIVHEAQLAKARAAMVYGLALTNTHLGNVEKKYKFNLLDAALFDAYEQVGFSPYETEQHVNKVSNESLRSTRVNTVSRMHINIFVQLALTQVQQLRPNFQFTLPHQEKIMGFQQKTDGKINAIGRPHRLNPVYVFGRIGNNSGGGQDDRAALIAACCNQTTHDIIYFWDGDEVKDDLVESLNAKAGTNPHFYVARAIPIQPDILWPSQTFCDPHKVLAVFDRQ